MPGPPPKPPHQRRRRNAPTGGDDWTPLHPHRNEVPPLPAGDWHPRAVSSWEAWWRDPISPHWHPGDEEAVCILLGLVDAFYRGNHRLATEMRKWQDGLALSAKGKLRCRYFISTEEPTSAA